MTRSKNKRARLGGLLVLVLGAFALLAMPGVAAAKDRNHDRIPDRWEKRHHLSLNVNQAGRDQDGDHLRNLGEFKAGDNPRDDDSDNDGVMDGEENAGTIASFDASTGKLAIDLFGGDTVTGLITESTEIECRESGAPSASTSSEDGSDRGGGSDNTEAGDDNGGDEGRSGDDNSGPGDGNNAPCATSALVRGAVVHEAELEVGNGAASFEKVELAG